MNPSYARPFAVLLVFFSFPCAAQEWAWAHRAGGPDLDRGYAVVVDAAGNAYVAGEFQRTATFGSFTLTSAGFSDAFVAKYSPDGEVLWAQRAGGSGYDTGRAIALDDAGNLYVTGVFEGTAAFGPFTLTSTGLYDTYVAKYGPDGSVLWVRGAGGSGGDITSGYAIALDASGAATVTGSFEGNTTFGAFTLTSAGEGDAFVVRYSSEGEVLWAERAGGPRGDRGEGVAVDADGNVTITGFFHGTASFGTFALTSVGHSDVFVVKYGSGGPVLWAQRAGGAEVDGGSGIAIDPSGNAYVAGEFHGTATFGPFTLTSAGFSDAFVAKYGPDGAALWAERAGGAAVDFALDLTLNASSDPYVTGAFNGPASFGPFTLLGSGGFVAKYAPDGGVQWAEVAGLASANGHVIAFAVAVAVGGDAYVTGFFGGTVTFGPYSLTSPVYTDAFVARLTGLSTDSEPSAVAGTTALSVFPNPAAFAATARFTLAQHGPVRLTLYDVLGREVAVIAEGVRSSGEHAVSLDASRLPVGLYVLRLATPTGTATRPLTVVR